MSSHAFLLDYASIATPSSSTLASVNADKAFYKSLYAELRPGTLGFIGCLPAAQARVGIALRLAGFEIKDCLMYVGERGNVAFVLAQRAVEKTYALNALKHGCGALNTDQCRVAIAAGEDLARDNGGVEVLSLGGTAGAVPNRAAQRKAAGLPTEGRFPANLLVDGSESVTARFPKTAASKASAGRNGNNVQGVTGILAPRKLDQVRGHTDAGGSAVRYFQACPSHETTLEYLARLLLLPVECELLTDGSEAVIAAAVIAGWPRISNLSSQGATA